MLILTRKLNESINIGDSIEVSVIEIKGDQVKLGIAAPREIKVYRKELYLAIQRENEEAALTSVDLPEIGGLINNEGFRSIED
ncbi:MAG: carbon storage regulator CsrA [Spirochaetales bacterium]|nr:carbon storage regulator CsrA [Spirochaetales bacterium]